MKWAKREVAADISVSVSQIERYLRAEQYPGLNTIRRIERVYGWDLRDQLDFIPEDGTFNPDYAAEFVRRLDLIAHTNKEKSS